MVSETPKHILMVFVLHLTTGASLRLSLDLAQYSSEGLPKDISSVFDFSPYSGSVHVSDANLFPDCALLGSSATLVNKGYGDAIDNHYPVIRVNRLPSQDYFDDFGSRTDIFFGNNWERNKGRLSVMSQAASQDCAQKPSCYESVDCTESSSDFGKLCPKDAILFKMPEYFPDRMAPISETWKKSSVPIGYGHSNITLATRKMIRRGPLLSTGLQAFLYFAPLCKQLTMYGFKGVQSADGHAQDPNDETEYGEEHAFYNIAANGDVSTRDFGDQHDSTVDWLIKRMNQNRIQLK